MADNNSLQDCLVFIFPAKGISEQLVGQISNAAREIGRGQEFAVDGLAIAVDNMQLDGLAACVEAGGKVVVQLKNGNCVVPVGLKYELGGVSAVELYDPLVKDVLLTVPKAQFLGQWSGLVIALDDNVTEVEADRPSLHALTDFSKIFRNYQDYLGPILFSGLMVSLLSLASPFFFMLVLDKVVSYRAWSTLTALGVGAVFLIAFECLFEYIRAQFLSRMVKSVGGDASGVIFKHTATLPSEIYESRPLGAWINDNRQSERLVRLLRQISMSSVEYAFAFVFLAVLLWLNWILTCVAIATCLLQISFAFYFRGVSERKGSESQAGMERKESFLVETLTHLRTIKILGLLGQRADDYAERIAQAELSRQERDDAEGFIRSVSTFIERAGNIAMLAVGAAMVMQSSLTVGALVACNILMRRLTGPLSRLPLLLSDLKELKSIQGRWHDIFRNVPSGSVHGEGGVRKKLLGGLEFKKVFFRYRRESRFQMMVDAQFPRGETIAVVGKSGAGKTTLLNLMLGLNVPQVGLVCMDGSDLRELDLEHMRKQIGVVSHDVGLFRGTVSSNISAWDKSVSLDRIQSAARMACAHDYIQALSKGYETLVGDDGMNLSSGQKCRLALARALVRDPAILLLDEVTGDLDPSTEHALVSNIISSRRGRTTIFFTHREFVASHADVVFYMDEGRLIASGKHERLISENAGYRSIWGRA